MGIINPIGITIAVELDKTEREIIFTLKAVDEIQEHFDKPLQDVMTLLLEEDGKVLRYVLMILLNDEAERKQNENTRKYTEKEMGWIVTKSNQVKLVIAIMKAYGVSLPDAEEGKEEDDPNQKSGSVKK